MGTIMYNVQFGKSPLKSYFKTRCIVNTTFQYWKRYRLQAVLLPVTVQYTVPFPAQELLGPTPCTYTLVIYAALPGMVTIVLKRVQTLPMTTRRPHLMDIVPVPKVCCKRAEPATLLPFRVEAFFFQ
eukprot:290744-Pyramimonas_sp.AAC.3